MSLIILALEAEGLTRAQKNVLTALAARSDNATHQCWPSVQRLIADTGIKTRKAIIDATTELEALGILRKQRRKQNSILYTLNQEVMVTHTSRRNQEVAFSDQEVTFLDSRSKGNHHPNSKELSIKNSKGSGKSISHIEKKKSPSEKKNQSTRHRTLEEDLTDTSWAIE